MKFHYCPTCGSKTTLKDAMDDGMVNYCEPCQKYLFDFSYTAIITAVVNQYNEVILIKQKHIGDFYIMVAGFVIAGEDLETTCIREVKEEVNQDVKELKYVRSFYFERRDQLMVGFISRVDKREIILSQEVESAGWYPFEQALALVRPASIAYDMVLAASKHSF